MKLWGTIKESYSRLDIFIRDKWICYICKFKVRDLPNHPRQATLDHVIELSEGGSDTKDNVKCCCLKCNGDKAKKQFDMTKQEILIDLWTRKSSAREIQANIYVVDKADGWKLSTLKNTYWVLDKKEVLLFTRPSNSNCLEDDYPHLTLEQKTVNSIEEGFELCEKAIIENEDDNFYLKLMLDIDTDDELKHYLKLSRNGKIN